MSKLAAMYTSAVLGGSGSCGCPAAREGGAGLTVQLGAAHCDVPLWRQQARPLGRRYPAGASGRVGGLGEWWKGFWSFGGLGALLNAT